MNNYNYNYNYFIINNLTKDKIYHLTINNDLRFINFIGKNFYKTLLKFIDFGYIIKIYDWDSFFLKNEFSISNKLKIISNFNYYLSYFEYEDDFLYYFDNILNKNYPINNSIIFMINYHKYNISFIDNYSDIYNIYTQFIYALYTAFYKFNIYFDNFNIDLIFIIKNNYKKKLKYYNKNNIIYLNNCNYKIIISDYSYFNNNNNINFDIDNNIFNNIKILKHFNKFFNLSYNDFLYIKNKYFL
tara:strand:- start:836 stop:1564 length:729 start_codon:yes stop_codon:yes gene_type:complete